MEAMNGHGATEDGSGMDDPGSQLSDDDEDDDDDDQLGGSCASGDESNKMADEDTESLNQSLSSPGCLSGLSSLQSPSTTTSIASPLNMNISPATPALATVGPSVLLAADHAPGQSRSGSTSASASSSGSTCSISTTPNTSSTASPATIGPVTTTAHERAMMLGNRFSHLGMGLSLPMVGSVGNSNADAILQSHSIVASSTNTSLTTNGFCGSGASSKVLAPSNVHRNPIGANPRDINNPLSINQLTKRREEQSVVTLEGCDPQAVVASAAASLLQHAAPHGYHPHHALFSSSFSQHFHQQLSHHLAATNSNEVSALSVAAPAISTGKHRNPSEQSASATNPATPSASETGAISVS